MATKAAVGYPISRSCAGTSLRCRNALRSAEQRSERPARVTGEPVDPAAADVFRVADARRCRQTGWPRPWLVRRSALHETPAGGAFCHDDGGTTRRTGRAAWAARRGPTAHSPGPRPTGMRSAGRPLLAGLLACPFRKL